MAISTGLPPAAALAWTLKPMVGTPTSWVKAVGVLPLAVSTSSPVVLLTVS